MLVTGTVSTIVLLIAAVFIKSQDSLYYAVFAASSVVFLLPYLLMFPAALALRIKDPDRPRPFRVPGGVKKPRAKPRPLEPAAASRP